MPRFQHRPGTRLTLATILSWCVNTLATSPCPGAPYAGPPAPVLVGHDAGLPASPGGPPKLVCQPLPWQATTLAHQPVLVGQQQLALPALSVSLTPGVKTNTGCAGRGHSARHRPAPGLPQQAGFGQASVEVSDQHTDYKPRNQPTVTSKRMYALMLIKLLIVVKAKEDQQVSSTSTNCPAQDRTWQLVVTRASWLEASILTNSTFPTLPPSTVVAQPTECSRTNS